MLDCFIAYVYTVHNEAAWRTEWGRDRAVWVWVCVRVCYTNLCQEQKMILWINHDFDYLHIEMPAMAGRY